MWIYPPNMGVINFKHKNFTNSSIKLMTSRCLKECLRIRVLQILLEGLRHVESKHNAGILSRLKPRIT
jgi:hypothetical protein